MKPIYVIILLIVAIGVGYAISKAIEYNSNQRQACRPGTCPYVHPNGTIFCTSAACKQSSSSVEKTMNQPAPQLQPLQFVVLNRPRLTQTESSGLTMEGSGSLNTGLPK